MNIDRFERGWIYLSALVLVLLFGGIVYSAYGIGVEFPGDVGQVHPRELTETSPFDEPGVYRTGKDEVEVVLVARTFFFEPGEVRIPAGTTVTFTLTSGDVLHGFKIPNTTVNLMAVPGQISRIRHRFTEPGEYDFICHEYCGTGHHLMYGKIFVEE